MTVELPDLAPSANEQPSTVLTEQVNTQKPAEMKLEEQETPEPEKPMSVDEAVRKAASDVAEKAEKGKAEAEKPKVEPKAEKPAPERGENGKFKPKEQPAETQEVQSSEADADDDGEGEQEGEATRSSEGRDIDKPPARFLPRAKEKWGDVDPDVRGEVHRALSEMQKGMEEYKESHDFRKELRPYEELAKASGTTVTRALENYTAIDRLLRENPTAGVEKVLQSIGVTPQQYAQHVLGQAQQQAQNPAMAQTQQLQGQIQQLQQQIMQLTQGTEQDKAAARIAEVERSVIAPFREQHERYDELESDIVFFLNSGKIPSNIPERQRLEYAYDMAERINPAPVYGKAESVIPANQVHKPLNPAGRKSVKGAPSAGTTLKRNSAVMSIEDSIKAAMAERGA